MSITVIHHSASAGGLADLGTTPISPFYPPCRLSGLQVDVPGAGENRSGVWQCEPGKFERFSPNAEVMHILTGVCTFTPTGGKAISISAGDTLFFPARTTGVWHIQEAMRKVYVVMPLLPETPTT